MRNPTAPHLPNQQISAKSPIKRQTPKLAPNPQTRHFIRQFRAPSPSFRAPLPVISSTPPRHFEHSEKSAFSGSDIRRSTSDQAFLDSRFYDAISLFLVFALFAFSRLISPPFRAPSPSFRAPLPSFRAPLPVISSAARNLLFRFSARSQDRFDDCTSA